VKFEIKEVNNMIKNYISRLRNYIYLSRKYPKSKISIKTLIDLNSELGEYSKIYPQALISNSKIGKFTYVCPNTNIINTKVGSFCSIASGVRCGGGFHPSRDFISTNPIFYSTLGQTNIVVTDKDYFEELKPIEIGHDVWIGTNAIILDGVKIGTGAIIGAGAVVTKDVEPYAIVGGIPAKLIRYRFDREQINKLLNEIKWWEHDLEWIQKNYKLMHNISNIDML